MQPTLVCIHLASRMVFALLFISTKGLGHTEHPFVGKEFIKLWLIYRMEYCIAIKNDVDKS